MNIIFKRETEALKDDLMRMSGEIEMRLAVVLKAIEIRDTDTLQEWMGRDDEIDEKEVQIEEECLKILALHQPVACDLRFLVAVMKINNDLERIGDIIVNIASRGIKVSTFPVIGVIDEVIQMGHLVKEMLRECLDALIDFDVDRANAVIVRDDKLDTLNRDVIKTVVDLVSGETTGAAAEALIQVYTIARYIERIGDHITNIAEDVTYLVNGTIIRHQRLN